MKNWIFVFTYFPKSTMYNIIKAGSQTVFCLHIRTLIQKLNLQKAFSIYQLHILYFTHIINSLLSNKGCVLESIDTKCPLLLTNLEHRPRTGGFWSPPLMAPVCIINRALRRLILPVPAGKKRMNQNLIWLWCIIFILASATDPLKPSTLSRRILKDSNWLKLFDASNCTGVYTKFLSWVHIVVPKMTHKFTSNKFYSNEKWLEYGQSI